jgi:hypothetical protein
MSYCNIGNEYILCVGMRYERNSSDHDGYIMDIIQYTIATNSVKKLNVIDSSRARIWIGTVLFDRRYMYIFGGSDG